jgi:hypothetical protein
MILSLQRVHDSQDLWLDGGEAFDLRELRAELRMEIAATCMGSVAPCILASGWGRRGGFMPERAPRTEPMQVAAISISPGAVAILRTTREILSDPARHTQKARQGLHLVEGVAGIDLGARLGHAAQEAPAHRAGIPGADGETLTGHAAVLRVLDVALEV